MADRNNQYAKHIPLEVQTEINAGKNMFDSIRDKPHDEHYERIVEDLTRAVKQVDEEKTQDNTYLFDHDEFVDALDHILEDTRSALRKDKLSTKEFAERFNRWFVFCDALINLGFTCFYSKESLNEGDYESVFKTLVLNKAFESTFLMPRGIKVELRHKREEVTGKYPWLAMPVLVIQDDNEVEHTVSIAPSGHAVVWWFDILAYFHGAHEWPGGAWYDNVDYIDHEELEEEESCVECVDHDYPADVDNRDQSDSASECSQSLEMLENALAGPKHEESLVIHAEAKKGNNLWNRLLPRVKGFFNR